MQSSITVSLLIRRRFLPCLPPKFELPEPQLTYCTDIDSKKTIVHDAKSFSICAPRGCHLTEEDAPKKRSCQSSRKLQLLNLCGVPTEVWFEKGHPKVGVSTAVWYWQNSSGNGNKDRLHSKVRVHSWRCSACADSCAGPGQGRQSNDHRSADELYTLRWSWTRARVQECGSDDDGCCGMVARSF